MKSCKLLTVILLTLFIYTQYSAATPHPDGTPYCKDAEYSPDPHPKIFVPCPMETTPPVQRRQNTANATNMFQITLTCLDPDKVKCNKVQRAFNLAGQILTGSLILTEPVTVNATYTNFCTSFNDCPTNGFLTLGGAAPARTIPLKDSDGKTRFFPQSLVKQINSQNHPQFSQFDILAMFNSVANFWFEDDNVPIRQDQSDFSFVILHELVHGLGFTSSWDDYINQVPEALTPDVSPVSGGAGTSFQFAEFAFDKFMVLTSTGQKMSDITDQLNGFSNGAGAQIRDINAFASAFVTSPQYQVAKNTFKFAITKGAMSFLPQGETNINNAVTLETSLNPYQQGSSISHVDFATFSKTPDFLMRFLADRGVSLGDAIVKNGNFSGGAVGPKLLKVLESLG
ncbi:1198_t:CDS:2 [Paraglomus brasilianum]|uniref:1198_t:CDS:1 n=1 Tax=Paraglomus brasilianum TaxID=144538 RepID=A0A9N9FTX6_9GLOM|nr:1198_t:CDS:2 [Paraglomus brasilianum]